MIKNILFRSRDEQLWFENTNGLVFTDSKGRKNILVNDYTEDFDVACGDELNIVCTTPSGELVRLERKGEGWLKTVILKSRSNEMQYFGIRIINSDTSLNLIYGLNHNSEKLIVHQTLPEGRPQVITAVTDNNFFVRRDETGCVYIICETYENTWSMAVLRNGVWSGIENFMTDRKIKDILSCGYKNFCTVSEYDGVIAFDSAEEHFEAEGTEPSIVKANEKFNVISEYNSRILCTDANNKNKIITSDNIKDFYLRLPESGEFSVCERCRGSIIQGKPRLFLIDNAKPPKTAPGESVRLELTKQIISLESRIAKLEKAIKEISV